LATTRGHGRRDHSPVCRRLGRGLPA
jgi:hypothetical protein